MDEEFFRQHGFKLLLGAIFFILVLLLCGQYYENYQLTNFSEILQQEKYRYKKQIRKLKAQQEKHLAQLEPFIARAEYGFPDAPVEDRLGLLIMKMDEADLRWRGKQTLVNKDRVIPVKDRFYISNALERIPRLKLEITYPSDDPESCRLAMQINKIFDAAGWETLNIYPSTFSTPINDMVIEFGDKPSRQLQKALLPLYDTLGYERQAVLNIELPKNSMKIIVGHG